MGSQPRPEPRPLVPSPQTEDPNWADDLRQKFLALDKDRSGAITVEELYTALETQVGPGAARAYLSEFDMDGDGKITYAEFVTKVLEVGMGTMYDRERDPLARYREVFDTYDHNGDGHIATKELLSLARHLKLNPTEKDMLRLVKEYDIDGDSKVSLRALPRAPLLQGSAIDRDGASRPRCGRAAPGPSSQLARYPRR